MKPPLLRLVLAAVLFSGWMGYLSYLVYALPHSPNGLPIILSRPQALVSTVDVVGTLNLKDGTVQVQEVLYAPGDNKLAKGDEIKVSNFEDVKPPLAEQTNLGACLLLLHETPEPGVYSLVPVPPSPGFSRSSPRVYPATGETLAEYRQLHK